MLSPSSAGKIARSDSIPAGFACLKMIAAAFVELETARLAKKLKAAGRRGRGGSWPAARKAGAALARRACLAGP